MVYDRVIVVLLVAGCCTMYISEVIRAGVPVELSVLVGNEYLGQYVGQISQTPGHTFVVISLGLAPSDKNPIRAGEAVMVEIAMPDGTYSFRGPVLEQKQNFLAIAYPQELHHVQRRDYYRQPLKVDMVFKVAGSPLTYKGTTTDISGGGMGFICPKKMNVDNEITLSFTLPNGLACNAILAKIRQVNALPKPKVPGVYQQFKYGVRFEKLPQAIRNSIVTCLIEIERTARKARLDE